METEPRRRILDAALALFLKAGIEGARSADICRRAGVSNGSLFHFFPNKEAVAAALYLECIADYQATLTAALRGARTPAAAIRAVVLAQCRWAETSERQAKFLMIYGRDHWSAGVERRLRALNVGFLKAVAAWRADQRTRLRAMPREAFVAILLGPSLMAIRAWLVSGGPRPTSLAPAFARSAVQSLIRESRQ